MRKTRWRGGAEEERAKALRQSKVEVYLHFVWATTQRLPTITPDIERAVYRCIQQEAQQLGCEVLALNGMPDHVHLLVKVPSRLSPAKIMMQVKGVSSHFVHGQLPGHEGLRWQEGYGVFSVGRNQRKMIIAYIENQKEHHADNTVHSEWEETDEEYILSSPSPTIRTPDVSARLPVRRTVGGTPPRRVVHGPDWNAYEL